MSFHLLNEQEVHVEDGLDLATLGRKNLNFLMDKKTYYQMMAEDHWMSKTISHKGNKNIFDYGTFSRYSGWTTTTDGFFGADASTVGFYATPYAHRTISPNMRKGKMNTISDYCGYWEATARSLTSPDFKIGQWIKMGERLELGKVYTFSFKYTLSKATQDLGGSDNNGNGKAGEVAFENGLEMDLNYFKVNGKHVTGKSNPRVLSSLGYNSTQPFLDEQVWEEVSYTFKVTKVPPAGAKWIQIRLWRGSTLRIAEPKLEEGDKVTEFQTDRRDEADNQGQMGDLGYRSQAPNFGFYYNEELKIFSSYKVNDMKKPLLQGYYPETDQFMVELEIEVFNLITNAKENKAGSLNNSSGVNRTNSVSRFIKEFFDDKTMQGGVKGQVTYTCGKGGVIYVPYHKDKIGKHGDNTQSQQIPYYETHGKTMIYKSGSDSMPDSEVDFSKETLYTGNMIQVTDRN